MIMVCLHDQKKNFVVENTLWSSLGKCRAKEDQDKITHSDTFLLETKRWAVGFV